MRKQDDGAVLAMREAGNPSRRALREVSSLGNENDRDRRAGILETDKRRDRPQANWIDAPEPGRERGQFFWRFDADFRRMLRSHRSIMTAPSVRHRFQVTSRDRGQHCAAVSIWALTTPIC